MWMSCPRRSIRVCLACASAGEDRVSQLVCRGRSSFGFRAGWPVTVAFTLTVSVSFASCKEDRYKLVFPTDPHRSRSALDIVETLMYWLQNINLLLSYVLYLSFESSVLAIVPAPQEYLKGRQHLRLSSFSIKASKDLDALPDLHAAIERASETLQQESHQRVIVGRGEEDRAAVYEAATLNSLHLALDESCGRDELGDISQDAVKPLEDRNEAYTLKVHEGEAFLTSCTAIGIFRGLSTFLQLVYALPPADGKQAKYVVDAPLTIRVSGWITNSESPNPQLSSGLGCIPLERYPTGYIAKLLSSRLPQIDA